MPDVLNPDDITQLLLRSQALRMAPQQFGGAITPAAPQQPPPQAQPGIAPMTMGPQRSPMVAPPIGGQQKADQDKLAADTENGSGVQQFQRRHPVIGGLLRGLDIAGSALLPGLAARIPGTSMHHEQVLNQDRGAVTSDLANADKEATAQELFARKNEAQARADQIANAPPKEEKAPETMETAEGIKAWNGQTRTWDLIDQPAKKDKEPKQFEDSEGNLWQTGPNGPEPVSVNGKQLKGKQAAQKEPNAIEGIRQKLVSETDPAKRKQLQQQLKDLNPQAEQSLIFRESEALKHDQAAEDKKGKPTADEQRRADLASNMNENLDQLEDVLKRRPELFGPIAGRITEAKGAIGTSDPDIAALHTIKEQMGMAMVGAHAMRNAQHVETAANAIINGYHNSPEAMSAAIRAARNSAATFLRDADNPGQARPGGGAASAGGGAPTITTKAQYDKLPSGAVYLEDGKKYKKP